MRRGRFHATPEASGREGGYANARPRPPPVVVPHRGRSRRLRLVFLDAVGDERGEDLREDALRRAPRGAKRRVRPMPRGVLLGRLRLRPVRVLQQQLLGARRHVRRHGEQYVRAAGVRREALGRRERRPPGRVRAHVPALRRLRGEHRRDVERRLRDLGEDGASRARGRLRLRGEPGLQSR